MTTKRTETVIIRLTPDEKQSLLLRKTKPRLAEWLRELALGQKPKRQPKSIDPALLFELNRIGVNLKSKRPCVAVDPAYQNENWGGKNEAYRILAK